MSDETRWLEECMSGASLSEEAVERLEHDLAEHPDDLSARVQLVGFYDRKRDEGGQRRRAIHVHWLIANRPEIDIRKYREFVAKLVPHDYAEGKRHWLAHVAARPHDLAILRGASKFLLLEDPELAEELIRRGATLAPASEEWHDWLAQLHLMRAATANDDEQRLRNAREAVSDYERALALVTSRSSRLIHSIDLMKAYFQAADHERAAQLAASTLAEASDFDGMWFYGNAIHHAHIVLGHVALASGDVSAACVHLAAAGATPGSPQLDSFGPDFALATLLLECGERDAVIAYLEACKRFWSWEAAALRNWQECIRQGKTPSFKTYEDDARATP